MSDSLAPLDSEITHSSTALHDEAGLRHRHASQDSAGEYTVPERIAAPSTINAVAAVESPLEKTPVVEKTVVVEQPVVEVLEPMPGDYYEDSDDEPTIVEALKSTVQEAQTGIASLIDTVRRRVSQGSAQAPSLETLRSAIPAVSPPSLSPATAGAKTGSVVGTVAGTLTAASEIAASAASHAGHSVAETVRSAIPETAPTLEAPASLPAIPSVTERATTVARNAQDVASSAYQVATEKAAVATHSAGEVAQTVGSRVAEARAVAAQSASESYKQSAEKTAANIEMAKETAEHVAQVVKEAVVTAVHKVEEVAEAALKKTAHTAGVATGAATQTLHKASDVAAPVIARAADTVTHTAVSAKDAVGSAAATTYHTTASTAISAKEAITNVASSTKDTVVGAASTAYDKAANTGIAAKEAIAGAASSTYDKAAATGTATRETVAGGVSSATSTGAAAKDAVAAKVSDTYNAAAASAVAVKETVVGAAANAGASIVHAKDAVLESASSTATAARAVVFGDKTAPTETVDTTSESKPSILTGAQESLGSAVTAVKSTALNAASNVASTVSSAPAVAYNAATSAAAAVASAPSTALNYVRGTSPAPAEKSATPTQVEGVYPEYVQGEMASSEGPTERTYSAEEIKEAEEAERARRDKPGMVARQAFEHAQAEANAFVAGMREHLGESANIPVLAVPRREIIREAEEAERAERVDAEYAQRLNAAKQASILAEGLKAETGGDHLHSALDVARMAQIRGQEEEEREARIVSMEPKASLAVAAAVKEGLFSGDEASPAVHAARKEITRAVEEQARDEKITTALGEEPLAHKLAAAFDSEIASSSAPVADVAKKGRLDVAEESEREDRIRSGWRSEAKAHEQARLVAEGFDTVDLKHVSSGPAQLKELENAEEEERDRRIRDAANNDYKPYNAPNVAAAVKEGLAHAHDDKGVNNPAVKIATREIGKDLQEQEREEKMNSGDGLRVSGSPTRTAFAVREGLLREENPATDVARKVAEREGVEDSLSGVRGKGITPSKINTVHAAGRSAFDTVKELGSSSSPTTVPISNFGSHSPVGVLGSTDLAACGPAPPPREDSVLLPEVETSDATETQPAVAQATDAQTHERSDSDAVGLDTIRPSPDEIARESADTEGYERSGSPESGKTASTTESDNTKEGHKKPKKVTGLLHKAIGKIELGLGKITHNEHLIERGEELHAAGAAEIHAAKAKAR